MFSLYRRSYFHGLCEELVHEAQQTGDAKKSQVSFRKQKTWSILFGSETADGHCILCPEQSRTTYTLDDYPSGAKLQQGHILAAKFGALDDKLWWNCVPLCKSCNSSQGATNLFDYLITNNREKLAKDIGLRYFKALCEQASCPIDFVSKYSLLAFVSGFYAIHFDVSAKEWQCLLLTDKEVNRCRRKLA